MNKFENLNLDQINNSVIFLDIDGTIVVHGEKTYTRKIEDKIQELKKNNRVYICSNNRNNERNQELSRKLDLPIINKQYKKPDRKILAFLESSEKKRPFVVIGDKLYPDKLFAKRIKADFIQVERITSGQESWPIQFTYWIDTFFRFFLS